MWLLLETVQRSTATSHDILTLVVSLGMPSTIGRARLTRGMADGHGHVWGVRMPDEQTARDAEWVLHRHPDAVVAALGVPATLCVTDAPPTFEQTRKTKGRADA